MSKQKITNLANRTDSNDALNFQYLFSLDDKISAYDEKYIEQEINMDGEFAVNYANMMAMPLLNVAPSADLVSAVNCSHLNNHNTFNLHVN